MGSNQWDLVLRPHVRAPNDPATGKPVDYVEARLSQLVATLERSRTRIIVPTPALSELLVRAPGPAGIALIEQLQRSSVFKIVPFDTRAAVELAAMTYAELNSRERRRGVAVPYQKVKFDRQIVAIAKVEGATAIYSDDGSLISFAEDNGIKAIRLADLPFPESARQGELALSPATAAPEQQMLSSAPEPVLPSGGEPVPEQPSPPPPDESIGAEKKTEESD